MLTSEVAAHFGVKPTTVRAWARRGCPHVKPFSRQEQYQFDLPEVEAWKVERDRQAKKNMTAHYDPPPGFMSCQDVATHFGVSVEAVQNWARRGCPHVTHKRRVFFASTYSVAFWRRERAKEVRALRTEQIQVANQERLEEAKKKGLYTVLDTHHFFGLKSFTAKAWRDVFQPTRPVPEANLADLVHPLQRALKAIGFELISETNYVAEEDTTYRLPRGAKEKVDVLLGPALCDSDLEE